ncbi:low choriolytic enzyme-like isoform X2 [Hydractinia symbiolongicarpus]|uniref:low choriolytic enzyme-like isoform X2 n=1 Tax=Hydractinia symbiolongicarpus TaxID=13093 RepID=UPI00254E659F|nr:low choriolytic enzyme-like isoform X2 [Hydractinia symbiolongicarpus]
MLNFKDSLTMAQVVVFLILVLSSVVKSSWIKQMEDPALFEGDMVLTPSQLQQVKEGTFTFSSVTSKNRLWPNGIIPYTISSELKREQKAMKELNEAIKQYHTYTCLRFKRRTTEKGYIEFYKGGGCSSPVGYGGGRNWVSLGQWCWWRATIMHEIGHSIGFVHEQTRPDRNKYVKILFENIIKGFEHNFKTRSSTEISSKGMPYDYRSMMHYSWNAFGKEQKMTIQTLDPSKQHEIGQDEGFSHIDIQKINNLYGCTGVYPTLPPYVPPPKGCFNSGASCTGDANSGHCTNRVYRDYMRKSCRKACGLCGHGITAPPPGCEDILGNCEQLGQAKCKDKNPLWANLMKEKCKLFCNFC